MGASLAHGSGADELLVVGLPLVLFAAYLWFDVRRQRTADRDESPDGSRDPAGD